MRNLGRRQRRWAVVLTAIGCVPLLAREAQAWPAAAVASRPEQPLSFGEFQRLQQEYCREVIDYLNAPVDWHLVIDVSGSRRSSAESLPATVANIVRRLPLQPSDTLWLDSFDSTYGEGGYPGALTAPRVRQLHLAGSGTREAVAAWLPPIADRSVEAHTDLEWLPDELAAAQHAHCAGTRSYFIVLTDGVNDPPDRDPVERLFAHSDPAAASAAPAAPSWCLGERLVSLVSAGAAPATPDRLLGILVLIDPRFLAEDDRRRVGWEWGRRAQRDMSWHLAQGGQAPLRPQIVMLDPDSSEDLLDEDTRLALRRQDDLIPCLFSTPPSAGHTAPWSDYPRPQGRLGGCLSEPTGCQLNIPRISLLRSLAKRDLPLVLLARGVKARVLRIEVEGASTDLRSLRTLDVRPIDTGAAGWRPFHTWLELSFSEEVLSEQPPPWNMLLALEENAAAQPFLRLHLSNSQASMMVAAGASVSEIGQWLHRWGRPYALLALVFAYISFVLTERGSERIKVAMGLTAIPANHPVRFDPADYEHVYHDKQFRFAFTGKQLEQLSATAGEPATCTEVFRSNGPTLASDAKLELDVIPIFGMLYVVVYYEDPDYKLIWRSMDGKPIEVKQLDVSMNQRTGLFGLFIPPQSFWVPERQPSTAEAEGDRQSPLQAMLAPVLRRASAIDAWIRPRRFEWKQEVPLPEMDVVTGDARRSIVDPYGRPVPPSVERLPTQSLRVAASLTDTPAWQWSTIILVTDLALTCSILALIASFSMETGSSLWGVFWSVFGGLLSLRMLIHGFLTCPGRYPGWRRALKNYGGYTAVGVMALGILLPWVSSPGVRLLLVALVALTCFGMSRGMDYVVRRRIQARAEIDKWDLWFEWFRRISPIVF